MCLKLTRSYIDAASAHRRYGNGCSNRLEIKPCYIFFDARMYIVILIVYRFISLLTRHSSTSRSRVVASSAQSFVFISWWASLAAHILPVPLGFAALIFAPQKFRLEFIPDVTQSGELVINCGHIITSTKQLYPWHDRPSLIIFTRYNVSEYKV
jgi:hypothetical protein